MESIISFFVELVKQAILSGFIVYGVLITILGSTSWATFRGKNWRKIAAYALGWLIAIFMIFIVATSSPDLQPSNGLLFIANDGVDILSLLIPGGIGFAVGFALLLVLSRSADSESISAIIIALVTAGSASMLFLVSVTSGPVRNSIGSLTIASTIGALSYIVFLGIPGRASLHRSSPTDNPDPYSMKHDFPKRR